jgi:hypothetical protein
LFYQGTYIAGRTHGDPTTFYLGASYLATYRFHVKLRVMVGVKVVEVGVKVIRVRIKNSGRMWSNSDQA